MITIRFISLTFIYTTNPFLRVSHLQKQHSKLNYVGYDIFHGSQTHHGPFAALKYVAIERGYAVNRIVL